MDLWSPPVDWGVSADLKHLKNLYIYFWRWATWKVFGSGHVATTGEPEADRAGVVCFITAAAFLSGSGFQKMRDDLRRDCSDIWIIDCSPEGHQPDVPTRIFQGVQQPVCITLAVRPPGKDRTKPARLHFRTLPKGPREVKFDALGSVTIGHDGWSEGLNGWRDPFLPKRKDLWGAFLSLDACFAQTSSGVLPGRTWVVAPDRDSLRRRWATLVTERSPTVKEDLFFPTLRHGKLADRHTNKVVNERLKGHEFRAVTVAKTRGHP